MKHIIIMLLPVILFAEALELLYEKVPQSSLYKSKSEIIHASYEAKKASLYTDTWSVGLMGAYADVDLGNNSGGEFAVSLDRDFNLQSSKVDTLIKQTKAYSKLQEEVIQSKIKVKLWQLYGNYCTTMNTLQAKSNLANVYYKISKHIKKGFQYGEFDSGKVLMSKLSLENINMQIFKLENAVQNYEAQIQGIVPFDRQFECKHLQVNLDKLFDQESSTLWPVLQKQLSQIESELLLVQERVTKFNIQANYSHEVDTKRYMLNLSLPLNFGKKNEAKKIAVLSNISAKSNELKTFQNSYLYESNALKNRLNTYNQYLSLTEQELKKSANLLIKRSNIRFKAGEESLIEMLKATEIKLQTIESLFNLKIDRHNAITEYMYKYAINPQGVSK